MSTMDVALNRKRSRLSLDNDNDGDGLKRSRTEGELESLAMVSPQDAWVIDVASILASNTLPSPPAGHMQPHSNAARQTSKSITVLCVQGNVQLHYDLLWAMLPDLYAMAPSLQAVVLCCDPSTHIPSATTTHSLPLVQAVGPSYNHFVRLGLLHPQGGGQSPLDALVVLDAQGRRRLVLPFGWGAGRHAGGPAGRVVQSRLMELLRMCIETLARE